MNKLGIGIFCLFLTAATAGEFTLTFNAEPLKKTSNARLNELQDTYTHLETNAKSLYQNIQRIKEAAEPASMWHNQMDSLQYQIEMLQNDVNERLEAIKESSLNNDDELSNAFWLAENTATLLETMQLIMNELRIAPVQGAVHLPQHYKAEAIDVI